jgi:flagellar protein FliS
MTPTQAQPASAYLKTKVMTAGSGELRLMLFDGAIRFAEQGRAGLARKDHEAAYNGISRAPEILIELINCLKPEHAPELCARLSGLYTFMYRRLVEASQERKAEFVDEVLGLLRYERETWMMVLDKLAQENQSAGRLDETPEASPAQNGKRPHEGLIGGTVSFRG